MARALTTLTLILVLSACAQPERRAETPSPAAASAMTELARVFPGRYGSAERLDASRAPAHLEVVLETRAGNALEFLLLQQDSQGRERGFLLSLEALDSPEWLDGQFTPLGPDGNPGLRSCRMRFRMGAEGLVGETDPAQCRFGSDDQPVGLLKEIAFDGAQLRIADQLISLGDGNPMADADVMELHRLGRFAGRARVRDGDNDWRTASDVRVTTGGSLVEPLDAAGMSLGMTIDLTLVEGREGDPPVMALRLIDEEANRVLGQAWTDPAADRIGLVLDHAQVELRRIED